MFLATFRSSIGLVALCQSRSRVRGVELTETVFFLTLTFLILGIGNMRGQETVIKAGGLLYSVL